MENTNHKPVNLDDLATMVADGFNEMGERFNEMGERVDKLENRMDKLDVRMDNLGVRMDKLDNKMTALNSTVNRYLDLSDERYLELKNRDKFLAGLLKAVCDKTGVPMDLSQLGKI